MDVQVTEHDHNIYNMCTEYDHDIYNTEQIIEQNHDTNSPSQNLGHYIFLHSWCKPTNSDHIHPGISEIAE